MLFQYFTAVINIHEFYSQWPIWNRSEVRDLCAIARKYRDSCPEVFCKKSVLTKKTHVPESIYNKVDGCRTGILLKKRLRNMFYKFREIFQLSSWKHLFHELQDLSWTTGPVTQWNVFKIITDQSSSGILARCLDFSLSKAVTITLNTSLLIYTATVKSSSENLILFNQ